MEDSNWLDERDLVDDSDHVDKGEDEENIRFTKPCCQMAAINLSLVFQQLLRLQSYQILKMTHSPKVPPNLSMILLGLAKEKMQRNQLP